MKNGKKFMPRKCQPGNLKEKDHYRYRFMCMLSIYKKGYIRL